jgi:hypothetical protein
MDTPLELGKIESFRIKRLILGKRREIPIAKQPN